MTITSASLGFDLCQRSDVASHAGQLRAFCRGLAKKRGEVGLLVTKEIGDWRGAVFVAWRERGMRGRGIVIPGADFLADVAAEGVRCERNVRQRAAMFDGCVTDAVFRGHGAVWQDRVGRTRIEAARAGA